MSAAATGSALATRGLTRRFGGLVATNDVSFTLETGARHALIGPNGAGKTTFLNLLTGALSPTQGRILLGGVDVTRESVDARVRRGMARTFQITQLFPDMSPLETLTLVVSRRLGEAGRWWSVAGANRTALRRATEIAERFGLADCLGERAGGLPYGKQRLLEIAIAFACEPRVLLLDEPAAGVPQADRRELLGAIAELPEEVAVLLIEHDMDLVFSFARRISVLVDGALLVEGRTSEVAADPRVRAVYLGEAGHG